jgi:hypothetical protein
MLLQWNYPMNNDEYNHIETIRGRQYRYDPDFDAYYRVQPAESAVSRWAWVAVIIMLSIVCWAIELHSGGTV